MSTQQRVAEWLNDEFGDGTEADADYMPDAADFIAYLKAKGLEMVNSSTLAMMRRREPTKKELAARKKGAAMR